MARKNLSRPLFLGGGSWHLASGHKCTSVKGMAGRHEDLTRTRTTRLGSATIRTTALEIQEAMSVLTATAKQGGRMQVQVKNAADRLKTPRNKQEPRIFICALRLLLEDTPNCI